MKSFAVILLAVIVAYSSASILPVHDNRNIFNNIANTVGTAVDSTVAKVETAVGSATSTLSTLNQEIVKDAVQAFQKLPSIDICKIKESSLDCCVTVKNLTVCSNVVATNGPSGLSLSYVLTLNTVVLFKKTIDTSTLPLTQCVPLPQVPAVQLCLTPFNLSLSSTQIGACFELSAKVMTSTLLGVNLHCYQLSNKTLAILPPGKGPVQAAVTVDTSFLPTPAPVPIPFINQISSFFSKFH